MKLKRVCVFCGSNPGNSPAFADAARHLGSTLAERDITVVYGGSSVGLMGRVADAALEAGGEVIGVIPEKLRAKEIFHSGLSELHVVDSMHERKALMAELSNAFIALPGGIGTFEEFFEVLTWNQIGYHEKPCGLLNIEGYYTKLASFLDDVVDHGFLVGEHRNMVLAATSAEELLEQFTAYDPPEVEKWIERKKGL